MGKGYDLYSGEAEGGIADPLAFFYAEHDRQRVLCDRLDRLIEPIKLDRVKPEAELLVRFLTHDLRAHIADEEHDLLPMLELRCAPDDGLDGLLKQIQHEHEMDIDLVDFLLDDLRTLARSGTLHNPTRLFINLKEFTATQRRHLEWENSTILPLAEKRLTKEDLAELRQNMTERRGTQPDTPIVDSFTEEPG